MSIFDALEQRMQVAFRDSFDARPVNRTHEGDSNGKETLFTDADSGSGISINAFGVRWSDKLSAIQISPTSKFKTTNCIEDIEIKIRRNQENDPDNRIEEKKRHLKTCKSRL